MSDSNQTIVLGGGCFWCTESVFLAVQGVVDVESGYSNGQVVRPSYEQVCTGRTGCNEVVRLVFDPALISLREVLEVFFVIHDPTTLNRQGNDAGTQYRSGIYFNDAAQQEVAQGVIAEMAASGSLPPAHRDRGAALGQLLAGRGLPPGFLCPQPRPRLLRGRGRTQGGQVPQDLCPAGQVRPRALTARPSRIANRTSEPGAALFLGNNAT